TLVLLYLEERKFAAAFELIKQLPQTSPNGTEDGNENLCYAYAASGDTAHAKSLLEKIRESPKQNPLMLAYIYIALKNYDEALTMLESAYKLRHIQLYWIKVDPLLDPVRNEPRFKALLAKMNLE